jgi:hypothetical protein
MKEAIFIYRQALTNTQEKALIGIINRFTEHRIPPISTIITNLAEEIRGALIGKN